MAVELTATDYSGIGTGASATYATGIYANASNQIKVYVAGVLQTLGVNYSLNGLGASTGVNVVGTFANGATVYIERVTPITQLVDTKNNETILEDVLDAAFDKLTLIAQEQARDIGRTVKLPKGEAGFVFPAAAERINRVFGFDALGAAALLAVTGTVITDPALINFRQAGIGAIDRTVDQKLRERVTALDFGATGPKIAQAIAAHPTVVFPAGSYTNTDTAIALPFGKLARFENGAALVNSGSGSFTSSGTLVHENHNPSGITGFTGTWPIAGLNYEGFSVNIGGFGPRGFGPWNAPTGVSGAVKTAASSAMFGTFGVAGWVDNASVFTNAVALYGQADRRATDALAWGLNTRTLDHGFGGLNIWGYECNLNIDNVNTIGIGIDLVGGSTVEPNLSVALSVQAIGVFASPKKRWTYGLRTRDAATIVGVELGAQLDAANSPSQIFRMNFMTGAGTPGTGFQVQVDGSGNAQVNGGTGATLFALRTPASTAANIQMLGDGLGFYGAFPQGKRNITGSRAGNAALASLLTGLSEIGLITNNTTA